MGCDVGADLQPGGLGDIAKEDDHIAEADARSVAQGDSAIGSHRRVVEERAVGTPEVGERPLACGEAQDGVLSADALGAAADRV